MLVRKYFILIIWLFAFATIVACKSEDLIAESNNMHYARFLSISKAKDFYSVTIINPWDTTKILQKLILTDKSEKENLPQGTIVKTPLRRSLVATSVHCSLIEELGEGDAISSVFDAKYLGSEALKDKINKGEVIDCGNSLSPSIEKIISARPDAILISPYEQNNLTKLENLSIPIVMCADYMETSSLGRAEWIKLYGLLYGQEEKADSIFRSTASKYNQLKSIVDTLRHKPSVLSEKRMGQVWYVPGAKSTIGYLYSDAGASNPFAGMESASGSIPLSPEKVFYHAKNADVWLLKSDIDISLESLGKENSMYKQFSSFKKKNVWVCNTFKTRFYERAPFHPELILADFIRIFHPEIMLGGDNAFYFKASEGRRFK